MNDKSLIDYVDVGFIALGISFLIDCYLYKKDLKKLINDHQNIGHIYTPQRKQSKYLNNKYQKYKKLRESLNNIW